MATPDPNETNTLVTIIGGAAGGLITMLAAIALAARRATKMWGEAKTDHASDSARAELINNLRDEMSRMAEQNGKLAQCVNSLQLEVANLRGENAELRHTIRHLNSEVRLLRQAGAHSGFGGFVPQDPLA